MFDVICNPTPTHLVEILLAAYPQFKTQEAYSVVRTLHAQHGIRIKKALASYLESDEAWEISEEAFNELVSILGDQES